MEVLEWQERSVLLLGKDRIEKLSKSHVLVVGLGGVGAYAAENLCRAGVGRMTIADGDVVMPSNINRQLPAYHSSIGRNKTEMMAERLIDINPLLQLNIVNEYLTPDGMRDLLSSRPFDYVADAIDTLSPKIYLIYETIKRNIPLVSSMGAGGRMDPSLVQISDISQSYNCRLAYNIRKRLRRLGVTTGFKVIFSPETADRNSVLHLEGETNKKSTVGTISYMPPLYGCYLASVIVRDLADGRLY
ncbi:MAG: ThiF family adenylyltransferase [Bacteroidales bacterium]